VPITLSGLLVGFPSAISSSLVAVVQPKIKKTIDARKKKTIHGGVKQLKRA